MTALEQPAGPHLQAGEKAASEERWLEALDSFGKACAIDPSSCAAFQGLSVAHHRLGHPEEAWEAAVHAWKLDPSDPDSEPNLRDLASEQGREAELERVLSGDRPGSSADLCSAGEAAVEAGRIPEAVLDFLEAIDADPSGSRAWGGIGIACFRNGWATASRAFFEMAIRLDPSDEDSVLNWTDASSQALSTDQIDRALESMGVSPALRSKAVSSKGP
jgi:Flp pilus assembly protein TadD